MPISRDDFDRGRTEDSWEDRFTAFLNERPGQGFTAEELATALEYPLPPKPDESTKPTNRDEKMDRWLDGIMRWQELFSLEQDLQSLAENGKIEARWVETAEGRQRYFAAKP